MKTRLLTLVGMSVATFASAEDIQGAKFEPVMKMTVPLSAQLTGSAETSLDIYINSNGVIQDLSRSQENSQDGELEIGCIYYPGFGCIDDGSGVGGGTNRDTDTLFVRVLPKLGSGGAETMTLEAINLSSGNSQFLSLPKFNVDATGNLKIE